jgi:hypothetical protein
MTILQVNALIRKADKLFDSAARAWERGNNSGNNATMAACEARCETLRNEAEQLLKPLGIEVDYPGLYPSFTVNGFGYHTTESAVSAALEGKEQAVWIQIATVGDAFTMTAKCACSLQAVIVKAFYAANALLGKLRIGANGTVS